MTAPLLLESGELAVTITPEVGGTITQIAVKRSGLKVLGSVPWPVTNAPIASGAARNEPEWLTRYSGGWPLLFPMAAMRARSTVCSTASMAKARSRLGMWFRTPSTGWFSRDASPPFPSRCGAWWSWMAIS